MNSDLRNITADARVWAKGVAEDARAWAKGLEDGIAPDQVLYSILPTRNLRLLIADLRRFADAIDSLEEEAQAIIEVCANAGIGETGQSALDRVKELHKALGEQIDLANSRSNQQ